MRYPIALLAVGLLWGGARSTVQAQVREDPASPQIRTQGTATRSVRPDLAIITLDFSAMGKTPLLAGQNVALRADSLRRALQAIGIPRDSLVSRSRWYYWQGRIEPVLGPARYYPPPPGEYGQNRMEQDTTYRALDAILVRLRDLSKLGQVIDTALAHRIISISAVEFRATESDSVRGVVLAEATRDAFRQATIMAQAGGVRLGRIVLLTTQSDYDPYAYFGPAQIGVTAGQSSSQGTQVVEPLLPITATVSGRWEIAGQP